MPEVVKLSTTFVQTLALYTLPTAICFYLLCLSTHCSKGNSIWLLALEPALLQASSLGCCCAQELLKTQTALKNLIQRNRDLPVELLAARNKEAQKGPTALQLPFILIQVICPACHLAYALLDLPVSTISLVSGYSSAHACFAARLTVCAMLTVLWSWMSHKCGHLCGLM